MTSDAWHEKVKAASSAHAKPKGTTFAYGTAGFRTKASLLDSVVFRVGLLAALRSKKLHGQVIGVMITASHNPAEDNGVKIVDPQGDMMEQSWEAYATALANAQDDDAVIHALQHVVERHKIDIEAVEANVIYAVDTRPSSKSLAVALKDGLNALDASSKDFGLKTTPQLHYLVRCVNTENTPASYGEPTEKGYYEKLAAAFHALMKGKPRASKVYVDSANGVGAPKLREFKRVLGDDVLSLEIVNDDIDDPAKLNRDCGADFVKTQQRQPLSSSAPAGARCASFDGDADRLVYYYTDPSGDGKDGKFHLLDGDKIATLAAMFLKDLIAQCGLDINVGVVQTAYANGSSTSYLEKTLGVPVTCTPTGVKHLHHAAQRFDVGVYFEANGHGTVLFSHSTLALLQAHEAQSPAQQSALDALRALVDLINQTVGDALSDLLLVEVILANKGWGLDEWDGCYKDLPNRLVRVVVADPTIYKTTDAERKLISPPGIQDKIDELCSKYKETRVFVRPSGTEPCVRVYAEARERAEVDGISMTVAGMLQ
ncbi:Phosphoacetylglucosamine Mutase [Savitreella phatthalungensis]